MLTAMRQVIDFNNKNTIGRFDHLDNDNRLILSHVDTAYDRLISVLTDEAKEGPRLFSLVPVDRSNFNPKEWTSTKFRLTLWCEHSRVPLPVHNGMDSKLGVYELEFTRDWFKKAAPFLKLMSGTLRLILPIALSGIKLHLDDTSYEAIEEQLSFGGDVIDASLSTSERGLDWLGVGDALLSGHGDMIRGQDGTLRGIHALLKQKDPSFGGLVRVMNNHQEFLWVHPQFKGEY